MLTTLRRDRRRPIVRHLLVATAAIAQLPPGTVVDGEVVVWNGARLDFGLLQRRSSSRSS